VCARLAGLATTRGEGVPHETRRPFPTLRVLGDDACVKTAGLGRRLGDWLGIVVDDETSGSASPRPEVVARKPSRDSRRESSHDEQRELSARPALAANAPRPLRVRRVTPTTPEFRAEVLSLREAVDELRAGLDLDTSHKN
jgi:hypothetical protein